MSTLVDPAQVVARTRYRAFARGDINAFFGLTLDNVGDMILMAGLLVGFGFPSEFVIGKMIPGTALGVMFGDLVYTFMAFRLAKRLGRDVTAMPLGLDTPSTFGTVFLILFPAFLNARKAVEQGGLGLSAEGAARHAWFIGIAMILASGIFKLACAFVSGWVRRIVPRAGLLGSLVSIALVIISFLPLIDVAAQPVAGFVALAVILATLTAGWELPKKIPGALGAVLIGCLALGAMNGLYWALNRFGGMHLPMAWSDGAMPEMRIRAMLPVPIVEWWAWFRVFWADAVTYLPVAIPLALATVVGGIDCAESAAAAGDDYPTGPIIAVEGLATIVGGIFGGVIQSTPYIGHPAYKAMGARAGYTLATALFIGGAGVFGYFEWIFFLLPKSVVFPILIFVGLEITAQSFRATPRRHYPALALSCVPALAYLALVTIKNVGVTSPGAFAALTPEAQHWVQTVTILSGGFIVTSLLWGTALAKLIDGKIKAASLTFILGGAFALFGIIHSPLPSGPIVLPTTAMKQLVAENRVAATRSQTPYHWAAAYIAVAVVLLLIGKTGTPPGPEHAEEPHAV
ncbi:MAG: hypothetical protein JWN86_4663 [Planctomycetota bacterium]|nr:hypothetical protein [Planctomycetota bacterium]